MSDALLTEISKKLSDIHATLKSSGGAASAGATPPKSPAPSSSDANKIAGDATLTPAQKKEAADKAIAAKKAAAETAKKTAAATSAPTAGTKAKGGKHTIEQVREIIRKVANDVDKQSAKDILKDDGNGVEKVAELKPEFYDAVYEACEVVLGGEGKGAAPAVEEEDDFA